MWENIKQILLRLFGVKPKEDSILHAKEDAERYRDISKENFTAIFANALSALSFADSTVSVIPEKGKEPNKRSEYLNGIAKRHWQKMKHIIAVGNGCGMVCSLPYSVTVGGVRKIYIDTVSKDRFFVTGMQGDEITKCTVISDVCRLNYQTYLRFTDYSIENGVYIIRQKATRNGNEVPLDSVPEWENIVPEIRIGNVKKLPIGIYRCPTSGRRAKQPDGVPVTFGCDATLSKIADCLRDIENEFGQKKLKIFAPQSLFDKDMKLSAKVYVKLHPSAKLNDKENIDVFDPAFRDSALYNRLEHLYAQLEKEVGTSRGILTDLQTNGATATEIKRATFQTFALCDDIHTNAERYFSDLMYGVNVLCEFYRLTPPGDYAVQYDWSYSMLEDPQQTFNQFMQAKSVGAVDTAEIRRFVIDGETDEEARKRVEEIRESDPSMSQIIGE